MDNNPGRIPLDQNRRNILGGVSTADGETILPGEIDSATGGLLVKTVSGSSGGGTQYTTGSTTPATPIGNMLVYDNGGTIADITATQGLPVNIVGGISGTQYTEGATTSPGVGTLSLGRYNSPAPTLAAGAMESLQLDSAGNLLVNVKVGGSSASTGGSISVTSGDVSTVGGQPIAITNPGTQLISLADELGDPLKSTTTGALDIAIANVAIDGSENLKTAPGAFEVANPFNSTEQGCALSVKTTQGYLLSILVTNYNAAKRYLHIISKPTAPAAGDTPTFSIPIPAGNSVQPAYVSIGQELFGQGGCYLQFGVAVGVSTTANVFNQATSSDHTLAGLFV